MYKQKYLKYKTKYLDLKYRTLRGQAGGRTLRVQTGSSLKDALQNFIIMLPDLKGIGKNRKDKAFKGIDDSYLKQLVDLIERQQEYKKGVKSLSVEERKKKGKILSDEEKQLTGNDNWYWTIVNDLYKTFSIGNQLKWTMDSYVAGTIKKVEDIKSRLGPAIDKFNWLKKNGHIDKNQIIQRVDQLKGLTGQNGLETFLDGYENQLEQKTVDEAEVQKGREGGKLIYDGTDVKIINPVTEAGACYYGKGTKWCTAATQAENMFDTYAEDGPLYIIQPKKPGREGKEKYQLQFENEQYMDEKDEEIRLAELVTLKYPELYPELLKLNKDLNDYLLRDSVTRGYLPFMKSAIEGGLNLEEWGDTLLDYAMNGENNYDVIKLLFESGVDVDKAGILFKTVAVNTEPNLDMVKAVFELGFDPNEQMIQQGDTLLHLAVDNDYPDLKLVKFLLEKGADPNYSRWKRDTDTPFLRAFKKHKDNFDLMKLFIEKGANVNAKDGKGNTPLLSMVAEGYIGQDERELIKLLVESGAKVNERGADYKTPLMRMLELGNEEMIKFLAQKTPLITTGEIDLAKKHNLVDMLTAQKPLLKILSKDALSESDKDEIRSLVEKGERIDLSDVYLATQLDNSFGDELEKLKNKQWEELYGKLE